MSDDGETTLNVKGLDGLLKALKASPPYARVGVLGTDALRTDPGSLSKTATNAEIGAAHEFGTSKIPQRSFLRIPIAENLTKRMKTTGALDKKVFADVINTGSVIPWLQKIAVLAEQIVADAFASGGFGKWPSWKNPSYSNNAGQLLVDTGQLRNSITSEVKE